MGKRRKNRQVVIPFDGRPDRADPQVRGGKGASLAAMKALGLPIPPGFTISTSLWRAVQETSGRFPKRVEAQLSREMVSLERQTGKVFGSVENPLLVSVRSGAPVSMPGMMDTILNLGMTHEILSGMTATNRLFAENCFARLTSSFKKTTGVDLPNDPQMQLERAICGVLESWGSSRAIEYRKLNSISETLGTAVNVQVMVFGNSGPDSGTGVAFSHNLTTGERELTGEFLINAQGEDLVGGTSTPKPIVTMKSWNEKLYQELEGHLITLEQHFGDMVEVEFTVENGKLYLLQCRKAKPSAEAAAVYTVRGVWEKRFGKAEAVRRFRATQIAALKKTEFAEEFLGNILREHSYFSGLPVSPGAIVGKVALTSDQAVLMAKLGEKVVLVRPDTNPNDLSGMIASKAIVTEVGGATSHAAVVARDLSVPAVVSVPGILGSVRSGMTVSVDGARGLVVLGEVPVAESSSSKEANLLCRWWRSHQWPEPKIGYEWVGHKISANAILRGVYLADAMASKAAGSELLDEALSLRQKVNITAAEIFACYLAIAVWGELKHVSESVRVPVLDEYRTLCRDFMVSQADDYRFTRDPNHPFVKLLKNKELPVVAEFFRLAAHVFNHGGWSVGTRVGGKKWGEIAEAGYLFLSGKISHTIFADRVFDLRHNGGVLFNKHCMFTECTDERKLHEDLDRKKKLPLNELHRLLGKRNILWEERSLSFSTEFILFSEIENLWSRGAKLKLWGEKQ